MIRKFYLVNENENTFMLTGYGRNKTDIESLDNLGFEFDIEYHEFDARFVEIKRTIPQKTISMALVFYEGYDGFTKWREFVTKSKSLRLFYSLKDTKYCYVNVKSSSKTQLEAGILRSNVELECLSLWLVNKSAVINVTRTDDGKIYPYTYPYTYAISFNGTVEVENLSSRSVPIKLTIEGNVYNPNEKNDRRSEGKNEGVLLSDIGYIKSSIDRIEKSLDKLEQNYALLSERVVKVETELDAHIKNKAIHKVQGASK